MGYRRTSAADAERARADGERSEALIDVTKVNEKGEEGLPLDRALEDAFWTESAQPETTWSFSKIALPLALDADLI